MRPVVAIVGRPNVGKSTLFNRLLGYRKAVVEDVPGVTRDLNFADVEVGGRSFTLVDTGGFEPSSEEGVTAQVARQCRLAIEEADVVLFLLDVLDGPTPVDREIADLLRRTGKKVLFVVNKVDGPRQGQEVFDFYELGGEELYPISALHKRGLEELLDALLELLPEGPEEEQVQEGVRVAIVGRPNVGKSSLMNRILGYERAIVDEAPGTTRDAIDTAFSVDGKRYILIDTAGMRRKSRIGLQLERYCVWEAIRSIERSDVSLLLIDAQEGPTDQDSRIGGLIQRRGKGCILVVNKWDLAEGRVRRRDYKRALRERLHFLEHAPVLFTSAKTGQGVKEVLEAVDLVAAEAKKRVPTGRLNRWFRQLMAFHQPPLWRNRPVKLYYITQVSVAPPTFVVFANYPEGVNQNFQRFLLRKLREEFDFRGNPIRLLLRKRD